MTRVFVSAAFALAPALALQIVAPTLPRTITVQPAESPQIRVEVDAPSRPGALRLSLRDPALILTVAPVRDVSTRQQPGPQPSKRGRLIAGGIIGGSVGALLGATAGKRACRDRSRICVTQGATLGAAIGIGVAARPRQTSTPSSSRSKRDRMIAAGIIGAGLGTLLAVTVGQDACVGKGNWACLALGGGGGATVGVLIAR